MNIGDLVSMDAQNDEIWFGEVVGVQGDKIEVYYIERGRIIFGPIAMTYMKYIRIV